MRGEQRMIVTIHVTRMANRVFFSVLEKHEEIRKDKHFHQIKTSTRQSVESWDRWYWRRSPVTPGVTGGLRL